MVKVQNHERGPTYNFGKRNAPGETVSVSPGEAVDIDVDPDDPEFIAATTFGSLVMADRQPAKAAVPVNAVSSAGAAPSGENFVHPAEKPK